MVRVRAGRGHRKMKKSWRGASLQGMFEGNPVQMSTWKSFVVVVAVGGCSGGGGAYWGLR